jgi:hypothetical protein
MWRFFSRGRSFRNFAYSVVFGSLILLTASRQGFGQMDQGAINGQVKDPTGAVIPGAAVTLHDVDTGLTLKTKTDDNGVYAFSPIKIGNYAVSATAAGFQTTNQLHVRVDVQSRVQVNLTLQVGQSTQTVEVTSAPPLLQTQQASTGQVVSTEAINDTPLNGRNWVYIAQLSAGVAASNGSRGGGSGDFDANGQTPEQNNFILDGLDNNTSVVDYLNGASYTVRPPPDALAEFRLETSDYSAEFGHSAGAVLNASIKSGTNQIHGDAWEYFRNDYLDAHSWGTTTTQKYRENQFGATLGGPILKNKLFFFGDFEANRILFGSPGTYSVPTALMRQGNFSELLNPALTGTPATKLYEPGSGGSVPLTCGGQMNVLCPSQINPVALRLLDLYPTPNTNGGATYSNYLINRNVVNNTFQFDTRVDYNISDSDQAFARYSNSNNPASYPAPLGPILDGGGYSSDGASRFLNQSGVFSETHEFTPTLSNEVRAGYTHGHYSFLQENANTNISPSLGLGGVPYQALEGGIPTMAISGLSGIGAPGYYPANEYQNTLQILDNVTKIKGNHSLKFGVDFQRIDFYTLAPTYARGYYNFNGQYTGIPGVSYTGSGIADFLTDQMQSASITNVEGYDDQRWLRAAYAQDDWKVNSRLTVNLGVRYEYLSPMDEWYGHQARFTPLTPPQPGYGQGVYVLPESQKNAYLPPAFLNALAKDNIALQYSNNPGLVTTQDLNFAPRIGIAFQADSKTVIRAGSGIFYGGLSGVGGSPNIGSNPPFNFQSNFPAASCKAGPGNCPTNGYTLENGFAALLATPNGLLNNLATPSLVGSVSKEQTPYVESYNFTIERSIGTNMAATVGYVGSVSRHLADFPYPMGPAGIATSGTNTQTLEPFPNFGSGQFTEYNGVSTYNSLQTKLEKRFSDGLYFLTTYTWAHSLDDVRSPLDSGGGNRNTNIFGIMGDYSNSAFDVRQRFTLNGNYELPVGRGKKFLNHGGVGEYVLGGWTLSLTYQAQTGIPFSVTPNNATAAGGTNIYAEPVGNPFAAGGTPPVSNSSITCAAQTRTTLHWYNPCAFGNPLGGNTIPAGVIITNPILAGPYFGGVRNDIYGPGFMQMNMSLFKNFPTFGEHQSLQLRADVFNVTNTPILANPSTANDASAGGLITATRSLQTNNPAGRFFQLAAKYIF